MCPFVLGRPVLVSDCAPLARIVREGGGGRVFPSGDVAAMSEEIRALADPDLRRRLGARGETAARERWSWDREGDRLVTFYDRILAGGRA